MFNCIINDECSSAFFLAFIVQCTIIRVVMETREIRRYSNRRLYDMETSQAITHAELAGLIKAGNQVRVLDVGSGEDITLTVLGKVLVTETSGWKDIKESRDLLQKIISLGGDRSMSILKNTILASIGALEVTKKKAEAIIDDLIKKGDVNRSDRKKAVMELLEKAEKSTADIRKKLSKEADSVQKSAAKLAKELNWARQTDLKKLETKVNKLAKAIKELQQKK